MKFLSKFYLFSGLSKLRSTRGAIKAKRCIPIDDFEDRMVEEMDCNVEWPVCLYDFTYSRQY